MRIVKPQSPIRHGITSLIVHQQHQHLQRSRRGFSHRAMPGILKRQNTAPPYLGHIRLEIR